MLSAEELHRRALTASRSGRLRHARRLLEEARRRTEDGDLLSRIEVTLAYVEAELGDSGLGLELCASALSRAEIAPQTRGVAHSQSGLLLMRRGETSRALEEYTRALEHLDETSEYAARAHLNRGNVHLQRGDLAEAHSDFVHARDVYRAAGLSLSADRAGHNLAYVQFLRGELPAALALMDSLHPRLATLGPVYVAAMAQDRAEALRAAGLVGEAVDALAAAAKTFGQRRLPQFQAEAELVQARTLLAGDPARAARIARRASQRFSRQGSVVWALRADAAALVAEVQAGRRSAALVQRTDELVGPLRRHRLLADLATVQLAAVRVLVRRGQLDEAAVRLRGVRVPASAPVVTRLLHREIRSDLARARGQRNRSLAHLREGLADLHAWQSAFGSLDLQSSLVDHGRQLVTDGLRIAVESGSPGLLFEWSERARALTSRVTEVQPPTDSTLAEELTELRFLQSQRPDPRSAEGRRVAQLRQRIRRHAWYDAGSRPVSEPAAMADVQVALAEDDAALVAYVWQRRRVTALVVTGDDATACDLGPQEPVERLMGGLAADLDMAAWERDPDLRALIRSGLQSRLAHLDRLLLEPLVPLVGERRVLLTPPGSLTPMPWTLLPSLVGRSLSVPPSATVWLDGRGDPPPPRRRVGFVAGPAVERAEQEVALASRPWPDAHVLVGADASPSQVSDLAARVDVLHLAAHGHHVAENPLFSAVDLQGGPWFGYDIDQLASIPRLVVLSSCELGRAAVRGQAYLVGMTAAWLHAGADCVIAAPSLVNDEDAFILLPEVHARLAAGQDAGEALAQAQVATGVAAPFVCYGAGW